MKSTCWKNFSVPQIFLLLAFSLLITSNASAADFAISLKTGAVKLADETQLHDGTIRTFDDNSSRTFGVAWEVRNDRNVGLGMEYLTFEHEFTPPAAGNGYNQSKIYMFSARKFFSLNKVIQPFAGIGLGWGVAKYDDGIGNVDRDWNPTLQISGGVEFRFAEEFGLFVEAKGLMSGTDGERENEVDYSGSGIMAGISFIF